MRKLILAFLFAPLPLMAQTCTTATCNAATASRPDVLAALPSNANSNATVVVNIPAGSATWSSPIVYTVPSAVTNLTVQGATTVTCTGTAGASSWSCPATDSTIITDGVTNANTPTLDLTTGTSTTFFRLTGLTLKTAAGTAKNDGMLRVGGDSQNVRIDHNHIDENGQNNSMIETVGTISGVADHNLFSLGNNSNVGNGFRNFSSSDGVGDASWAAATAWGTTGNWWYLESDYFTGGSPTDCYNGGKLAVRYSTFDSIYVSALHGTKNDAGRGRSCRATEFYHIYAKGSTNSDAVMGQNGGTSLIWGNNIASGFNRFNAPGAPRNFSGGDNVNGGAATPWLGLAGTTLRSAVTPTPEAGTDPWDGNSSTANGYPVLDCVGCGQGDLINFGSPAWPHEKHEPEYMWMNTLAAANEGAINDVSSQYNRDVYPDCGNAGSACSGSFNGTQGTGFGLHSARPATCTAGPGGTYGTSPTGSYGVGYWETDTNGLYACDGVPANHWQLIYTPLVYPHPLVNPTPPPPNFSLGITAVNGSVSGLNCSAGSYASGTSIGACTATPNAGYHLVSWSGTGSGATCSGTGTCGPFSLAVNSTLTATFALNSWTLTTATAGSGTGTITGCAGAHNFGASFSCTVTATSGAITSVSGCGGSGTTTFTGTMPNNACTVTATFSNTLATPTFTPPAGTYSTAQSVTIGPSAATVAFTGSEGSNGNASTGTAPTRNLYTNCAEGWNGSALTPTGVPVGNLYCNATDKANALAAGGPNQGVVSAANSGTGIHPVSNGNNAGGSGSAASLTAVYGQAFANECPVGTNIPSGISDVNLPGAVASSAINYGITTQSSGFNTSLLAPNKWPLGINIDAANAYLTEICNNVNTTSVSGEHIEMDTDHHLHGNDLFDFGKHFNFSDHKLYFAVHSASWQPMNIVEPNGTVHSTFTWNATDNVYWRFLEYRTPTCSSSSGSNCMFYLYACFRNYATGTPMFCGNLIDPNTGTTPGGIPVSQPTWTRDEIWTQQQIDVNGASANIVNHVAFKNLVAFSVSPNIYYTTNGSTPTTSSAQFLAPVSVPSTLTIKALAQQSGFTNSAVGSALYTITPTNSLVTTATNGSVSGSNCASGSYATGASIGACTATPSGGYSFTGWSGTGACSGASGTGTTSCTLSSNATLTATFTPIVTCGDPTQLSPNFSGTYTVPPTTLPMTVGFVSPTAGCVMHYTSDGSSPTCGSTAYPGGDFSITTAGAYTYRVIACQDGYVSSAVVGGTWTVNAAGTTTSVMGGTLTLSGTQGVQ